MLVWINGKCGYCGVGLVQSTLTSRDTGRALYMISVQNNSVYKFKKSEIAKENYITFDKKIKSAEDLMVFHGMDFFSHFTYTDKTDLVLMGKKGG
jgi:hypothetical protein